MSTGEIIRKNGEFAHHYDSAEQEYETSKHGVWTFLLTEILMFGGLFVGFSIFYNLHPDLFDAAGKLLDWKLGALNTAVLLLSSFTMALGIYFCQKDQKNKAVISLVITLLCGCVFLAVKYLEYSHKIHVGLLPNKFFHYTGPELAGFDNPGIFFSFYFCMTGLHGIHVLAGMGLITWVTIRTARGEFGPKYYTPVEGVGLFWHLVDLIWIYLFPLLYLI